MKVYQTVKQVYTSYPRCTTLAFLLVENFIAWGILLALHVVGR